MSNIVPQAQIMFNKDIVRCLESGDARSSLVRTLEAMVGSLGHLAGLVSSSLLPHQTMCIEALLTIDVHSRDIISTLINENVSEREDFEWTKYVVIGSLSVMNLLFLLPH